MHLTLNNYRKFYHTVSYLKNYLLISISLTWYSPWPQYNAKMIILFLNLLSVLRQFLG